ncbi:MAG: FHA domain-containing protein [Polyangiaceae bacterium]|jgi:hypothetical protein|nr:FHA domain-containing protein [Polyangiaceae bacterium]
MQPPALALALAVSSLILSLLGLGRVFLLGINVPILGSALKKLIAARNLDRMIKLCNAIPPNVPCGPGLRQAALRCQEPPPSSAHTGDYRNGHLNPDVLATELRRVYHETSTPLLQRTRLAVIPLGLSLLNGAAAAVLFPPFAPHPTAEWAYGMMLGGAALAALWTFRMLARIRQDTALAIEEVVDPLANGWASGAFLDAPPEPHRPPLSTRPPNSLRIEVLEPGQPLRQVFLSPSPVLKVGHASDVQLRLAHQSVARLHAVIEQQEGHWQLIDLGSVQGTTVNGEPVTSKALHPGDTLRFGEVEVRWDLPPLRPDFQAQPSPHLI